MIAIQLTLISLVLSANAHSIGTVSEKNVTKRETQLGDLFPDWVPFKNKHGEELGEFVQVKNKPKKRLALPLNFILRAVADPEGDDYYEKDGGGGSDSEDYYEKKDWSDTNRPVITADKPINHTQISEIDGVVNIITKQRPNSIVGVLKKTKQVSEEEKETEDGKEPEDTKYAKEPEDAKYAKQPENGKYAKETEDAKYAKEPEDVREPEYARETEGGEEDEEGEKKIPEKKGIIAEETKAANRKKAGKYEDDVDYEEDVEPPEKRKNESFNDEQERYENEAKKVRILNTVDELKERHAKEQVAISEKAKEEEMYKEEREREKIQAQLSSGPETDKYDYRTQKLKKKFPDYEEYEDKDVSLSEKYRPRASLVKAATAKAPRRTPMGKQMKEKKIESGKLSVFKNPQLYMIFDDDSSETTTNRPTTKNTIAARPETKYSAKYTASLGNGDIADRISLVPEGTDGKEGEPALFFPRRRKNKMQKNKFTTENDVSFKPTVTSTISDTGKKAKRTETTYPDTTTTGLVADTTTRLVAATSTGLVAPTSTGLAAPTSTGTDTTGSDSFKVDTTVVTAPSGSDIVPTHTEPVTDALPASTQHHKEPEKKVEDFHKEKGGGREHHSEHEEEHSEKGKKAYEGVHEETKSAKGYHDKENHLGKYDDHGGVDEHHEEESGHYGDHHHEEHGKKHAKYEESGKHSKGHSTKGSHDIHKKEEYEKKVEFFEEDGDSGEEEKHGGYNEENGHSKGGHFKNGNYHSGHEERAKGESGHFAKGGHLQLSKGHKAAVGHDVHGRHGGSRHAKEAKDSGKKWIYHHGIPAKTANLVIIDRRADRLAHGPQYYG